LYEQRGHVYFGVVRLHVWHWLEKEDGEGNGEKVEDSASMSTKENQTRVAITVSLYGDKGPDPQFWPRSRWRHLARNSSRVVLLKF
jgi:hypothetical protein